MALVGTTARMSHQEIRRNCGQEAFQTPPPLTATKPTSARFYVIVVKLNMTIWPGFASRDETLSFLDVMIGVRHFRCV